VRSGVSVVKRERSGAERVPSPEMDWGRRQRFRLSTSRYVAHICEWESHATSRILSHLS
jgi:hypothetical protein